MTLQAPRRKTSKNSDALTGEWLVPGSPRFVVNTSDTEKQRVERVHYYRARTSRIEPTGDVVTAPVALHRHETDAGGLGGLVYTVMMLQYLRYASEAQTRAEQFELIAWWQTPYGRERVRRGLERKLPAESARQVLEIVLTCHQEQADPALIAERFHHSEGWVRGKIDWCMRLALGHRETCQCATCAQRATRQQTTAQTTAQAT